VEAAQGGEEGQGRGVGQGGFHGHDGVAVEGVGEVDRERERVARLRRMDEGWGLAEGARGRGRGCRHVFIGMC
jgi:hypothetical protein